MASALASYPEPADAPIRDAARVMELGVRDAQDGTRIALVQLFGPAGTTSVQGLMGALR